MHKLCKTPANQCTLTLLPFDLILGRTSPQTGSGTKLGPPPATGPITGFVQISPAEINLKHQLALIPAIGRAFGNVTLYGGVGPALFGVETNFINGIPFATSSSTFPVSLPITVFNDNWVWGWRRARWHHVYVRPRLVLGFFLHLRALCELLNRKFVPVKNQIGSVTISGPAVLNAQERVTNQSLMLTLNYQFH
jgi:hypothetical protein